MFNFVVKYLGFLKSVPFFALIYDSLIKIWVLITASEKLNWFDEIEAEVLKWDSTNISLHKFGGTQFNYHQQEIGHLHSNGMLDILFSRKTKRKLLAEGRAEEHHVFKKSGWISFHISKAEDMINAKSLLKLSYNKMKGQVSIH